jgi:hypothetical protein
MLHQTLKISSMLGLVLLVACATGGDTDDTFGAELELAPRDSGHCTYDDCPEAPEDCDDWSQSGEGEGCMLDCQSGGPTAPIAWRFECGEVHVVSCKELSNVVLQFADGEVYKYDGLEGHYGTFGAGDKEIIGAWVKAGNNTSGDGPGYGMGIEPDGSECDDDNGGAGGMGGHPGTGGAAGMPGMGGSGGHAGAGGDYGSAGTGGDDCACGCDDDSDSDSDCDDDGDSDSDTDSDCNGDCDDDSNSDCDSDGDTDSDCDCGCDCKADIECPHGGKYGYIEVEFECYEAHVASCKALSNVVLELADGEHRKFDDLDGHCATLGIGEREIIGVWVKAGNNKSGDGPGYGERFDAPADSCDGAGGEGGAGGSGGSAGVGGGGAAGGAGGVVVH